MKTTITGLILAVVTAMQGHDLTDWKNYLIPVLVAGLGYFAADHKPANP